MGDRLRTPGGLRRAADPRVLGGIVLMAVSAYAGLMLLGDDEATVAVAVAARDLPAGIELQEGDLELAAVLVNEPHHYLGEASVAGTLTRPVGAGELVPAAALADAGSDYRTVAVPVDLERLPPGLARGARVDIWSSGTAVLTSASVLNVSDPEQWTGATATVVIAVAPQDVPDVLAATRAGPVDITGYEAGR